MTLTQLEYIIAVDKLKHFGKAAKSCHVTQPTLSMQIQKLEEELQITIFDRTKSPIQTTTEGSAIIEQASRILKEQKRLFSIIEEGQKELSGEFKLAVIPTLTPFLIPLFIHNFVNKYPKVNLKLEEAKTEDIISMLKKDEIDAALLATPLNEASIEEKVLYYEPFYLFINNDHPLAKKKTIKEEDLDINEIWLLNKGNCFREQVLNICSQKKGKDAEENINFESGNFETLKNMVLKGFGYTVLPYMAVQDLSSAQKKMIRPFTRPIPTREIALVFHKDCLKQRIVSSLEEEILGDIPDELRSIKSKNSQVVEFTLD